MYPIIRRAVLEPLMDEEPRKVAMGARGVNLYLDEKQDDS
jgi:hypothetical protein